MNRLDKGKRAQLVQQFVSITDSTENTALQCLQACTRSP